MPENKPSYPQHVIEYISRLKRSRGPILGFSERGVQVDYKVAGWEEIENVLRITGQERKSSFLGDRAWKSEGHSHSSLQWYLDAVGQRQSCSLNYSRGYGYGPQFDVGLMFDLFEDELLDKDRLPPHLRVMMLNRDLYDAGADWGLGLTDSNLGLLAVSPKRFLEGKYPEELALNMWRRLVRHEAGHLFGLVTRDYSYEEKLGRHCTNVCCMRQGMTMGEWQQLTVEEASKGIIFCTDCEQELKGKK